MRPRFDPRYYYRGYNDPDESFGDWLLGSLLGIVLAVVGVIVAVYLVLMGWDHLFGTHIAHAFLTWAQDLITNMTKPRPKGKSS